MCRFIKLNCIIVQSSLCKSHNYWRNVHVHVHVLSLLRRCIEAAFLRPGFCIFTFVWCLVVFGVRYCLCELCLSVCYVGTQFINGVHAACFFLYLVRNVLYVVCLDAESSLIILTTTMYLWIAPQIFMLMFVSRLRTHLKVSNLYESKRVNHCIEKF